MTRVIICEDEPLIALEIERVVEEAGGTVCGVFTSGEVAIAAAPALRPDVAIVDLTLADGATGADVAESLARLGCRILVLSSADSVNAKLCAIAHTFICKPLPAGLVTEVLEPILATRSAS